MNSLKNFNLNKLSKENMKRIDGGYVVITIGNTTCGCGCYYSGSSGSNTSDNMNANIAGGLSSPRK